MDKELIVTLYPTTSASPVNATNLTTSQSSVRNETIAKVEIAFLASILVIATAGNCCVIAALKYRKRKTTRMHMFILNLCIADLTVAFLNVLPQLIEEITFVHYGNNVTCKLRMYLSVVVLYASTYILLATAIDRFRAICYPLSNFSFKLKQSYLMIGMAWFMSLLIPIPQLFHFQMAPWEGTPYVSCVLKLASWHFRAYLVYFCVTIYVGPLVVLSVLYGKISRVVWINYRSRKTNNQDCNVVTYRFHTGDTTSYSNVSSGNTLRSNSTRGLSRAKLKTFKLTFVVIVAYALCWAPFIITQLWWEFAPNAPLNDMVFVVSLLMASLNSCCNPFIYLAFSGSLVQRILPCCNQICTPRNTRRCMTRANSLDQIMGRPNRFKENYCDFKKVPCAEILSEQNCSKYNGRLPDPKDKINKENASNQMSIKTKGHTNDPLYGQVMIDRRKCHSQPTLLLYKDSNSISNKSSSSGHKPNTRGVYIADV